MRPPVTNLSLWIHDNIETFVAVYDAHDPTKTELGVHVCPTPCRFRGSENHWMVHLADALMVALTPDEDAEPKAEPTLFEGELKMDRTTEDLTAELLTRIAGKRVVSVGSSGENLTLDDGTVLRLYESDSDCCASAHGRWVIQPDSLEAIITDVKITPDVEKSGDDGDGETNYATIAILHNQNPLALAECDANDGNGGYYFSVLSLKVALPNDANEFDMEIVSA